MGLEEVNICSPLRVYRLIIMNGNDSDNGVGLFFLSLEFLETFESFINVFQGSL